MTASSTYFSQRGNIRHIEWGAVVNQHFPYGRSVHVHAYYYPKCLLITTRVVYYYL